MVEPASATPKPKPQRVSHGIGFLTVSCVDPKCGAIYRAYRVVNPPTDAQIQYCMFCGSKGVGIIQDHDMDYIDVLAHSINKSPTVTERLLELWRMEVDEAKHEYRPPQTFMAFIKELEG